MAVIMSDTESTVELFELTGDEYAVRSSSCDLHDTFGRVLELFKVDKGFGSHLFCERFPLGAGVDDNYAKSHCGSELHTLNSDTTATAREAGPLSRA